jgi:transcriptional regulator of acetoin/glycerol metabolism
MTAPPVPLPTTPDHRLARIEAARRAVMNDEPLTALAMEPWIERSWRRCLASGQRPEQRVGFDVVSSHVLRRTLESNRNLIDPLFRHPDQCQWRRR